MQEPKPGIYIIELMQRWYSAILLSLYNVILWLTSLLLIPLSWVNPSVSIWLSGRKQAPKFAPPAGKKVIWMHCSSLGEFEQGRPVLEGLRQLQPDAFLALTFFSPSGYDRIRGWSGADWIGYLPLDTPRRARNFIGSMKPTLVLWVKYDFWFNHWREIHRRNIPVCLFAAKLHSHHFLASGWALPFRDVMLKARFIAVQDHQSLQLLEAWGYKNAFQAGDTRVDRVVSITKESFSDSWLESFAHGSNLLIGGSIWEPDLGLLAGIIKSNLLPGWKWVIAPHDISSTRIDTFQRVLGAQTRKYSSHVEADPKQTQIVLLDTMGMLNKLYRFGTIAYIGGGFGKGIHNLLEPAAYGVPMIFGPNHQKFVEASGLINCGAAYTIHNEETFKAVLEKLSDDKLRIKAGQAASDYIRQNIGATPRILKQIMILLDE